MFCKNCGHQIDDNTIICPYCGAPQQAADQQAGPAGPGNGSGAAGNAGNNGNAGNTGNYGNTGNTGNFAGQFGDAFDRAADDLGSGFESAAHDFANEARQSGQAFASGVENAANNVEEKAKNWRDYFTPENIEKFAVIGLLLPVAYLIVNAVMTFFFGNLLGNIPAVGVVFGIVPIVVRVIFIVASALAVAAACKCILSDKRKQTIWGWVTLAGDVLAFISIVAGVFHLPVAISVIFGLVAALYGIDALARVSLLKLGLESTPDISRDLGAYSAAGQEQKAKRAQQEQQQQVFIQSDPNASYFDGTGGTLFGLILLTVLVSGITCGIGTPWMLVKIFKWRKEHTVIGGRRLAFRGTGGSLLGHWILWSLLSVITCGIYSYFEYVALLRWEMKFTYYADDPNSVGVFDGSGIEYLGYGLLQSLLLMITCGIAFPWTDVMIRKWQIRHTVIGANRLQYTGTAGGILEQYIIVWALSIVTLGIYGCWGIVRLNKYYYSHTLVDYSVAPWTPVA